MAKAKLKDGEVPIPDLIERLNTMVRDAAKKLGPDEARFLVDTFYQLQHLRIAMGNQVTSSEKLRRDAGREPEPSLVQQWISHQMELLELRVQQILGKFVEGSELGDRLLSVCGIGPVIAAGMLANFDVSRAPTAGAFWRFYGADPSQHWLGREGGAAAVKAELERNGGNLDAAIDPLARLIGTRPETLRRLATTKKGEVVPMTRASLSAAAAKRPWNAKLKTLMWKAGDSFVKQSSNADCEYGHLYLKRKAEEIRRNDSGEYEDQARAQLRAKEYGKTTEAWAWLSGCFPAGACRQVADADTAQRPALLKKLKGEPGSGLPMLAPGHIHARATRYAVKIFVADFHRAAMWLTLGKKAPRAYVFEHVTGHEHVHEFRGCWVPNGA